MSEAVIDVPAKELKPKAKVELHRATVADVAAMTDLFIEFSEEHKFREAGFSVNPSSWHAAMFNNLVNNSLFFAVVAYDGEECVGGCGAEIGPSWLDQSQLVCSEKFWFVTKSHRGQLFSIRMQRAVEEWGRLAGATVIYFAALDSSPDSVDRYYRKRGFRPFDHYYVKGV